jgi:hypothetical protein
VGPARGLWRADRERGAALAAPPRVAREPRHPFSSGAVTSTRPSAGTRRWRSSTA